MVPARRRFLALCTGVAAAVAGCTDSQQTATDDDSPDEGERITEVTTYTTRIERPVDRQQGIQFDNDAAVRSRFPYVISEDDIGAIEFDPLPPEHDELLAFLRETAYDEQSVFITSWDVPGCHRNALEAVRLRTESEPGSGVSVDFCRVLRDPDVECSVDTRHHQVTLVRFPIGYDVPPSGAGRGWSRSCLDPRRRGENR